MNLSRQLISLAACSLASSVFAANANHQVNQATVAHSQGTLSKIHHFADQGWQIHSDRNNPFEKLSSSDFALSLLQEKQALGMHSITLGGYLQADAQYWRNNNIFKINNASASGSAFSITTTKLDASANINPWTLAFISGEAKNLGTVGETKLSVNKGFLVFGNLEKNPIYLTVGKNYIPFGQFLSGGPWTSSLDKSAFHSDEIPQITLNYYQHGLNTHVALFNSVKGQLSAFAYTAQYSGKLNNQSHYSMGAGYINDLRGMKDALGNITTDQSVYSKNIGALDLNAMVTYQKFTLAGEYLKTTRAVANNPKDASAWSTSLSYKTPIMGKTTNFLVGYSHTSNMRGIAIGLPNDPARGPASELKSQIIAAAQQEIFKNTFVGLEYVHAKDYSKHYANVMTIDGSYYF